MDLQNCVQPAIISPADGLEVQRPVRVQCGPVLLPYCRLNLVRGPGGGRQGGRQGRVQGESSPPQVGAADPHPYRCRRMGGRTDIGTSHQQHSRRRVAGEGSGSFVKRGRMD